MMSLKFRKLATKLVTNLRPSSRHYEIIVIAITRETARNMRERLAEKDNIPKEKHPEIISTMHS